MGGHSASPGRVPGSQSDPIARGGRDLIAAPPPWGGGGDLEDGEEVADEEEEVLLRLGLPRHAALPPQPVQLPQASCDRCPDRSGPVGGHGRKRSLGHPPGGRTKLLAIVFCFPTTFEIPSATVLFVESATFRKPRRRKKMEGDSLAPFRRPTKDG